MPCGPPPKRYRVAVGEVGGARVHRLRHRDARRPGGGPGPGRGVPGAARRGAFVPSPIAELPGPAVQVASDDPVLACMASQYAGWQVSVGKYFAMGSGPMRAAYGKEAALRPHRLSRIAASRRRRAGDAQAADRGGHRLPRRARAPAGRRADAAGRPVREPRRHACRWWPGRWRRPCTSCTSWGST